MGTCISSLKCTWTILFILYSGIACAGSGNTAVQHGDLNGTWVPVRQEMNGTLLPEASFENLRLIISDSTYTVIAESIDKGLVKISGNKMDIYGRDGVNAGKHFTAIFKFESMGPGIENGQLTICYNLAGDDYPGSFETGGRPLYFLSVFKREQVK